MQTTRNKQTNKILTTLSYSPALLPAGVVVLCCVLGTDTQQPKLIDERSSHLELFYEWQFVAELSLRNI